jgi:hypothetical protein
MGYGLHVLEIIFGLPVWEVDTSVLKVTQPRSEAHTACCPIGTGNSFNVGETPGAQADRFNPCRAVTKMVGVPKLCYFECLLIIHRDNLATLYESKIYAKICHCGRVVGGGADNLICLGLQLLRVSVAPEDVRTLDFR